MVINVLTLLYLSYISKPNFMEIKILMASKLNNEAIYKMYGEYAKRLDGYNVKLNFIDFKSSSCSNPTEVKSIDSKKLFELSKGYHRVLLDEKGKMHTSKTFSKWIVDSLETMKNVAFLIGGAYGHNKTLTDNCDEIISLSKLTFAHQLAFICLVEQIYRGMTINYGHPYHK